MLENVPVPATRKLSGEAANADARECTESMSVSDHPQRHHGKRSDETQVRQEPTDHGQDDAEAGHDGRSGEFYWPQGPGRGYGPSAPM